MWLLLAVAALPALRLMQSALLRVLNIGLGKVDPIAAALIQTRGWALGLAVVALVVAGPISEELLYRGLLLGRFRNHGYLVSGTLISTIVCMVSHRDPRQYLELCGAGLLLAGLYRRSNSLWPPIALHALNHGWDTILAILSRPS
jgi:membrane protease YdiL (CAAX protease family)